MASGRMIALLGLLAVAGYQNRDKIGELVGRLRSQSPAPSGTTGTSTTAAAQDSGGLFGGLGNLFGGNAGSATGTAANSGGIGGFLGNLFGGSSGQDGVNGGLRDLIDRFTGGGHEDVAKSWVEVGPNRSLETPALEQALGEDTISELTRQTGLDRSDLLTRLKAVLPAAVDALTPDGALPARPAGATA